MNPDDIKALIDQLLKTGEVLGTKLYEMSVRQVYTVAITDFVVAVLMLVAVLKISQKWRGWADKFENAPSGSPEEIFWGMATGISGVVTVISLVLTPFLLVNSFMYALNPQWYAVKWMMESLLGN